MQPALVIRLLSVVFVGALRGIPREALFCVLMFGLFGYPLYNESDYSSEAFGEFKNLKQQNKNDYR